MLATVALAVVVLISFGAATLVSWALLRLLVRAPKQPLPPAASFPPEPSSPGDSIGSVTPDAME